MNTTKLNIPLVIILFAFFYICQCSGGSGENSDPYIENATIQGKAGDYTTIQEAIDAAMDGDTVFVEDGIYKENIDFKGKTITVKSVNGSDTTTIHGDGSGSVVTFSSREGIGTLLDGFTITNGAGTRIEGGSTAGGAIFCFRSSPTITNCTIDENSAENMGGAIYCNESAVTLTNCVIKKNEAPYGGGFYCIVSSLSITDSTISENNGYAIGGGISIGSSSTVEITNCEITKNKAGSGCAGIYSNDASVTITDSQITHNSNNSTSSYNEDQYSGGGIECYGGTLMIDNCVITNNSGGTGSGLTLAGSVTMSNCTIMHNSTDYYGGGIFCHMNYPITITNCIIADNTVRDFDGGGIHCTQSSSPTIINCTIAENSAEYGGGISCDYGSSPTVLNCILWGNDATAGNSEVSISMSSSIDITFSDVQGGYTGNGNTSQDPLFVNTINGDYRLQSGSPCIDIGTAYRAPSHDISGNSRPQGMGVDFGAYEQ